LARRIVIGPQFEPSRERLGVIAGTVEAKAIARSINVLAETDGLPFSGDEQFLLPPSFWAWIHPIPRTQLAMIYSFDDELLIVRSLRRLR
jgi:hypothetical protein